MANRIDDLMTELMSLPPGEREQLSKMLAQSVQQVRDGGGGYYGSTSTGQGGMKRVTVVLPDDLAKQAQAAGLLGNQRIEQLIRQALRDHAHISPSERRKIVRKGGRLIVEALPGEQPITDADIRDALDKMEW